ncbi:hypothetical protein FMN52_00900 [Marinobacter sp. BW6]|uniref:hypothetical protein n=1 Tax=Marinobacter sp. BW6 TaxID=2592624 RepID=UPI0011DECA57|nr:hypothetical protein [Marinobacter sp. BW6]TYC63815.1 hypothetical protein FMN52_00900 [Marinobacter sp. BW6]
MRLKNVVKAALLASLLGSGSAVAEDWSREAILKFDTREVLGALEDALVVHDEIPTLEESTFIGRDQGDAEADLDELVEDAMSLFESEAINDLRTQYRELEERIEEQKKNLSEYRSERVLAVEDGRSLRTQLMPGDTLKSYVAVTKADYDMLIEASENNIEAYEEEKARTMTQMSQALNAIGVDLDSDQLEAMMSSVVGDDIVSMSVVFNAIKDMTTQLAELTQSSGEDLAHAKKYYGMVVVLHRIMAHMQASFIADVDETYLPKLTQYRDNAQSNIEESRDLISEGGNEETLENNIESNKLTIRVIELYADMLEGQRDKVAAAHEVTVREMKVADNTYRTVSLSSSVVSMIREGANTFDQLISLQMPDIREFQNEEVREEFRNLTERLAL